MKVTGHCPGVFMLLLAGIGLAGVHALSAQTPIVLHAFSRPDGAGPVAGLAADGDRLYGTTYVGGAFDMGTIYTVKRDGSDFRVLHAFEGNAATGGRPEHGVIVSGDILYGTIKDAGDAFAGAVYA